MKKATRAQMQLWLQYHGLAKLKRHINVSDLLNMGTDELTKLYKQSGGKTKLNLPEIKL